MRTSARTLVLVGLCLAVVGCDEDPLTEGCRYASGLSEDCDVLAGGRWYDPPPGFVIEELRGDQLRAAAATALTSEAQQLNSAAGPLSTRTSVDALDLFVLNRYLFMYSDQGTINDCIVRGQRDSVIALVTARDGSGYHPNLQFGPPSKLSSKAFESVFASSDLKAKLETDLAGALGNVAEARAAANVAFNAMRQSLASDVAVGTYRYLIVRSHPQVWSTLKSQGLVRAECDDKSVSQGVVVVGLDKRDRLVERTTGSDFRVALSAVVDSARLDQAVATAQASLSAEIRRQSQRVISVNLDSPAIVPLRWKPDRMR